MPPLAAATAVWAALVRCAVASGRRGEAGGAAAPAAVASEQPDQAGGELAPAACPWLHEAKPEIPEGLYPGTEEYRDAVLRQLVHPSSVCCDHGYGGPECFEQEYLGSPADLDGGLGDLTVGHLECCYPNLPKLLRDPAPPWLEEELRERFAPEAVDQVDGFFDSSEARDAFERECAMGPMSAFMRFRAHGAVGVRATDNLSARTYAIGIFDAVRRALRIIRYHAPTGSLDDLDVFALAYDCAIRSWPVSYLSRVRLRGLSGGGVGFLPVEWIMTVQARSVPDKIWSADMGWEMKQPKVFWRGSLISAFCHFYAVPDDFGFPDAFLPDLGPPAGLEPCAADSGFPRERRAPYTRGFGARLTLRNWYLHPRGLLGVLSKLAPSVVDARFANFTEHDFMIPADTEELLALVSALGMTTDEKANFYNHARYRYLINVDCADRLPWLLQMEAVVLVADTVMEQLIMPSSIFLPFEHYLPIKPDLSDVLERVAWAEGHQEEAAAIAKRGSRLARQLFTHENMLHYLYRIVVAQSEARKRRRMPPEARAPAEPLGQ